MAKDPAVLFYTSDFLTGTMLMSDEEVGQYIKLLCLQHQRGRLTKNHMLSICKTLDSEVLSKFQVDESGLYFNERMEEESIKRKNFTESRKHNGSKGGRPKKHKTTRKPSAKPSENLTENENEIEDIIEYLNKNTNKNFKTTTEKTKTTINARLKEGFTLDDFKAVIDIKVKHWLNDSKFSEYLRPETLFGTKFESYLNSDKSYKKVDFKELSLFECRYNAAPTKRYECKTEEEAKELYFNFGGCYPQTITKIR